MRNSQLALSLSAFNWRAAGSSNLDNLGPPKRGDRGGIHFAVDSWIQMRRDHRGFGTWYSVLRTGSSHHPSRVRSKEYSPPRIHADGVAEYRLKPPQEGYFFHQPSLLQPRA